MPEQELSIREREQALFVEGQEGNQNGPPVKPFPVYLQETPANPVASEVKVLLWIVGIVVFLLLCAALWRTQRPSRVRRPATATKTALGTVTPHIHMQGDGGTESIRRSAQGFVPEAGVASGSGDDRPSES